MITPGEYRLWLEGYLDGKTILNPLQIQEISDKAQQIAEGIQYFPYTYPWIYYEQPKMLAPQWSYTSWNVDAGAAVSGILGNSEVIKV